MTMISVCAKCGGKMTEGYILDLGHYNARSATAWVSGTPRKAFLGGLSLTDTQQYTIQSFRCVDCGYLESYAREASVTEPIEPAAD